MAKRKRKRPVRLTGEFGAAARRLQAAKRNLTLCYAALGKAMEWYPTYYVELEEQTGSGHSDDQMMDRMRILMKGLRVAQQREDAAFKALCDALKSKDQAASTTFSQLVDEKPAAGTEVPR